jgi:hypothetical protein
VHLHVFHEYGRLQNISQPICRSHTRGWPESRSPQVILTASRRVENTRRRQIHLHDNSIRMKILPSALRLLGNFLAISVLTCLFVTAFNLDFLPRGLSTRLFGRSLPGSLVTAPQGAVGYQPPPGPVADDARPTETSDKKAYKTITTTIMTRETTHELRQAPAAMRNSSTLHGYVCSF